MKDVCSKRQQYLDAFDSSLLLTVLYLIIGYNFQYSDNIAADILNLYCVFENGILTISVIKNSEIENCCFLNYGTISGT